MAEKFLLMRLFLYDMLQLHSNIKTTTKMMEEVLDVYDSEDSVVEVEVPRKLTPPLIYIEDDEMLLNIVEQKKESILAKDFIKNDQEFSLMPKEKALNDQVINTPNHWTSDMIKFYDDDWGDEEQFIVEKLQEKMDKTPSLWKTSYNDKLQMHNKSKRSNVRCWNCGQPGHNTSFCPEPPYIPKCHMCGIEGHLEFSCPDSKCLNCGRRSKEYLISCFKCRNQIHGICSRCRMIGHNFINCPDHWRLYHLTTESTSVIIPNRNIYKSDKDMWCSNCGKRGHYQTHCKKAKDCGGFCDSLPFVVSYQKAFNDSYLRNKQNDVLMKKNRSERYEVKAKNAFKKKTVNRAIRMDKMQSKNKFKKLKRWKKKIKKNNPQVV